MAYKLEKKNQKLPSLQTMIITIELGLESPIKPLSIETIPRLKNLTWCNSVHKINKMFDKKILNNITSLVVTTNTIPNFRMENVTTLSIIDKIHNFVYIISLSERMENLINSLVFIKFMGKKIKKLKFPKIKTLYLPMYFSVLIDDKINPILNILNNNCKHLKTLIVNIIEPSPVQPNKHVVIPKYVLAVKNITQTLPNVKIMFHGLDEYWFSYENLSNLVNCWKPPTNGRFIRFGIKLDKLMKWKVPENKPIHYSNAITVPYKIYFDEHNNIIRTSNEFIVNFGQSKLNFVT